MYLRICRRSRSCLRYSTQSPPLLSASAFSVFFCSDTFLFWHTDKFFPTAASVKLRQKRNCQQQIDSVIYFTFPPAHPAVKCIKTWSTPSVSSAPSLFFSIASQRIPCCSRQIPSQYKNSAFCKEPVYSFSANRFCFDSQIRIPVPCKIFQSPVPVFPEPVPPDNTQKHPFIWLMYNWFPFCTLLIIWRGVLNYALVMKSLFLIVSCKNHFI